MARGIDFMVARELIGGVYFGEHKTETVNGERVATDVMPMLSMRSSAFCAWALKRP